MKIQVRNATTDEWITNDPVLLPGEFGYDTEAKKARMGDGVSKWSELKEIGGATPILNDGESPVDLEPGSVYAVKSSLFGILFMDWAWNYGDGGGIYALSLGPSPQVVPVFPSPIWEDNNGQMVGIPNTTTVYTVGYVEGEVRLFSLDYNTAEMKQLSLVGEDTMITTDGTNIYTFSNDGVQSSPDGTTWTSVTSPPDTGTPKRYGDTVMVVGGTAVYVLNDGSWDTISPPAGITSINDAAGSGTELYIVDSNNNIQCYVTSTSTWNDLAFEATGVEFDSFGNYLYSWSDSGLESWKYDTGGGTWSHATELDNNVDRFSVGNQVSIASTTDGSFAGSRDGGWYQVDDYDNGGNPYAAIAPSFVDVYSLAQAQYGGWGKQVGGVTSGEVSAQLDSFMSDVILSGGSPGDVYTRTSYGATFMPLSQITVSIEEPDNSLIWIKPTKDPSVAVIGSKAGETENVWLGPDLISQYSSSAPYQGGSSRTKIPGGAAAVATSFNKCRCLTTYDGIAWTNRFELSPASPDAGYQFSDGVAALMVDGIGLIILTSDSIPTDPYRGTIRLWLSTDFESATEITTLGAYGGEQGLATNGTTILAWNNGALYSSTDGVNWTTGSITDIANIRSVVWCGTFWFAQGNQLTGAYPSSNRYSTSIDGDSWSTTTPADGVNDSVWTGSNLLVYGSARDAGNNPYSYVGKSTDGVNFTDITDSIPDTVGEYVNWILPLGDELIVGTGDTGDPSFTTEISVVNSDMTTWDVKETGMTLGVPVELGGNDIFGAFVRNGNTWQSLLPA